MLVEGVAGFQEGLGLGREFLGVAGGDGVKHSETRLAGGEFVQGRLGRGRIEEQGALAAVGAAGIVAEERPVAGVDRELLLVEAAGEVVAVGDAVAVGDDQGGAVEGLGLAQGGEGLAVLRAEGDAGDVDVAVLQGHEGDVLFPGGLAAGGELGHGAHGGGLGGLAAGVGVDLGVEHEDLHVGAGGEDVVETAVADVVGPAVAADGPDGFFNQVAGEGGELGGLGVGGEAGEFTAQQVDARSAGGEVGLGGRGGGGQLAHGVGIEARGEAFEQAARGGVALVGGLAQAEAELGVVLEERIRPGRATAGAVLAVGCGRQVAAVDRGTAGGVGDGQAVAEELGEELDVGRLAAAGAGAGELEQRAGELAALHGGQVEGGAVGPGDFLEEAPVGALDFQAGRGGDEVEGFVARV